MIFTQQGKINLATIGSSRSMRAFQAENLRENIESAFGYTPVIFDLSRAYRDPGHMYVFAKDLFAQHEVDFLLVEYKETGPQTVHQFFDRTSTFSQIFESYNSQPSLGWLSGIQNIVSFLVDRSTQRFTKLIMGRMSRSCAIAKKEIKAKTTDPSPPWFINSVLLKKQKERYDANWKEKESHSIAIEDVAEERNNYYINKLVSLARDHNSEIFFYYIPPLYGKPLSQDFVDKFVFKFDAKLIQLSEKQLDRIYPEGYTDSTHMGWGGARMYMKELAKVLPWDTITQVNLP